MLGFLQRLYTSEKFMDQLNVGIAGYGIVGKRRRKCIDEHSGLKVVGVCDRDFRGKGVLEDGVQYYQDYASLIREESLDVLFVCLTNDVAPDATIGGLRAGLHVFCEKPPGRDLDDILRVIKQERATPDLKLMYGFNHRYHDSVIDAIEIIRSGKLGRIISMHGTYGKSQLVTFNQPDWRTKREVAGGGVLLDQGIHMVDLMRLFAGEFTEIHSYVSNAYWGYNVEDNAYAMMKTEDGVVAMLHSSATQWRHRFNLYINMEKGSLILGGILSGSKSYGAETLTVINADPDNDMGDPKEQLVRYNKDPSWDSEVAYFADSVINNKPIESGTSEDAFRTMQLVYRIYHSDPAWRNQFSIPDPDGHSI